MTFVTLGLVYGLWYAYSVFLVALLREFGWSRSLLAGAFSTFVLVHGLLSPGLGWLTDRIGSRRVVVAGGSLLAVSLFLDGAIHTPASSTWSSASARPSASHRLDGCPPSC